MSFHLPSLLPQLQIALIPYKKFNPKWLSNNQCFLQPKEKQIVQTYLKTASYQNTAARQKMSSENVYFTVKAVVHKLNLMNQFYTTNHVSQKINKKINRVGATTRFVKQTPSMIIS